MTSPPQKQKLFVYTSHGFHIMALPFKINLWAVGGGGGGDGGIANDSQTIDLHNYVSSNIIVS